MKEIFVYLEGPSDQLGMRRLLGAIIERAFNEGNKLDFYFLRGKESLLNKGPKKAINILRNKPSSWVFLVPDLYPQNKPFPHCTYRELKVELEKRFDVELIRKNCDQRLKNHFIVHCFKYDIEVLLLASEEILLKRLETEKFSRQWITPVEDQNHNMPPKRIVENLFKDIGKKYNNIIDLPWILEQSDYNQLRTLCFQNFKLFLDDIFYLIESN